MKHLHYLLAALLFACLLDFSYGYYQFVRWAVMLGCAVLALHYYQRKKSMVTIVLLGLALLFQPFEKVALGREWWNVVDVVVGAGLVWLARRHSSSPHPPQYPTPNR